MQNPATSSHHNVLSETQGSKEVSQGLCWEEFGLYIDHVISTHFLDSTRAASVSSFQSIGLLIEFFGEMFPMLKANIHNFGNQCTTQVLKIINNN